MSTQENNFSQYTIVVSQTHFVCYNFGLLSLIASLQQKKNTVVEHSRKEVFQPHLPVRLPCYDLAPVTSFTLGRSSR